MIRYVLLVILSALLFGSGSVFSSYALSMGATAGSALLGRNLAALASAWLFCRVNRTAILIEKSRLRRLLGFLLCGGVPTVIFLTVAYQYLPAGTVTTIHFLYPAFVIIVDALVFHVVPGKWTRLFLITALGGMLLFFERSGNRNPLGYLAALLTACTWTFHVIGLGHLKVQGEEPARLAFCQALMVTIVSAVICILHPGGFTGVPISAWIALAAAGVTGTTLSTMLFQIGLRHIGPGLASVLSILEPVTSILLGALWLHDDLSVRQTAACGIVIVSVLFLTLLQHYGHDRTTPGV